MRRAADCIEGGSFSASHRGVRRCFCGLEGLGAGVKIQNGPTVRRAADSVDGEAHSRLFAWREVLLGRRVSVCVVASRV